MTPRVFNKNRDGWKGTGAVYVGRGSPWGNPFVIGPDGDREAVIKKFCEQVLPSLDVTPLRGKNLVCFCAPLACHADHLLKEANE